MGNWSGSSHNQESHPEELTLVPSASISPLLHPFPWTYKHTSFKIKVILLADEDAHYLRPYSPSA